MSEWQLCPNDNHVRLSFLTKLGGKSNTVASNLHFYQLFDLQLNILCEFDRELVVGP